MASLQELLAQDGFRRNNPRRQTAPTRPKDCRRRTIYEETGPAAVVTSAAPVTVSLCRDRRTVELSGGRCRPTQPSRHGGSSSFSSNRTSSTSAARSNSRSAVVTTTDSSSWHNDETVEPKAVVSILSRYAARFWKDAAFRREMREKCSASLGAGRTESVHAVLTNLEMGMESVHRLAEDGGRHHQGDSRMRSVRNSITLLTVAASLSSPTSRNGFTSGVPNSHLSACAQLYLAFVHTMERDDRTAARHLLQVFCNEPRLARRILLPDLWEHCFLLHLLHLQVWYDQEVAVAVAVGMDADEREQRTMVLNRVYEEQIDVGTAHVALYYKEWVKVGASAPVFPSVSLPAVPCYRAGPGRSVLGPSFSANRNLYQVMFGPSCEWDGGEDGFLATAASLDEDVEDGSEEGTCKHGNPFHGDMGVRQRLPHHTARGNPTTEPAPTPRRSYSFRLFSCRSDPRNGAVLPFHIPKPVPADPIPREANTNVDPPLDLGQAVAVISSCDSLTECEFAICVVVKAWLDSHGDPTVQTAISTASVMEGLLKVSFTSKDEEVLELTVCILAELVARSEVNRQVVLNADPQLEIFLRLLGIHRLFLKAAVLLYLLKPKAKQMLSVEWVPLVLRILKHGDQKQTLFTVQCHPKFAAFYFLDQLLTGFDIDRNVENARQVVSLGGLKLLIRSLEMRDARERKNVASLLTTCVRADGSCRAYLAANIKKTSILELLLGNQLKSNGCALSLLVEMMKLSRRTQITKFLNGLKHEGRLNTMHILLVYLQQAPAEQRPLVAAILLQLDLLGDTLQYSVYREEGIDALVAAVNCNSSKKVQENCSKALSILGGRFSGNGEATTEAWLLKRAGFDDGPTYAFSSKEMGAYDTTKLDDEEVAAENWQRRLAITLLGRAHEQFLTSLSNCIADAILSLSRSCLVTVAWMSISLPLLPSNSSIWSSARSVLMPQLLDCLNYDRAIEERVLASFSLLNLSRNQECRSKLLPLDKQTAALLHDLAQVTWTAREIILIETNDPISFIKFMNIASVDE